MTTEYQSLQHRWFDQVWNEGNASVIDELCDPNVVGHGLSDQDGAEIRGVDAFKAFHKAFLTAFPDLHIDIEQCVEQDDMSVVLCHCRATHTGEGFVAPATNRSIEFSGMCMIRQRGGRIVESWNSFDFLTVMQQLGLMGAAS